MKTTNDLNKSLFTNYNINSNGDLVIINGEGVEYIASIHKFARVKLQTEAVGAKKVLLDQMLTNTTVKSEYYVEAVVDGKIYHVDSAEIGFHLLKLNTGFEIFENKQLYDILKQLNPNLVSQEKGTKILNEMVYTMVNDLGCTIFGEFTPRPDKVERRTEECKNKNSFDNWDDLTHHFAKKLGLRDNLIPENKFTENQPGFVLTTEVFKAGRNNTEENANLMYEVLLSKAELNAAFKSRLIEIAQLGIMHFEISKNGTWGCDENKGEGRNYFGRTLTKVAHKICDDAKIKTKYSLEEHINILKSIKGPVLSDNFVMKNIMNRDESFRYNPENNDTKSKISNKI